MSNYENKTKSIRHLVQHPDPSVMAHALNEGAHGLDEALPNIAQSVRTVGARALNYLHAKMPKPSNQMMGDPEWEPGHSLKRQWLEAHDMVNDPISVLDHVKHGTLTSRHMDALQNVHPELLNDMRQKVMENMDPKAVRDLPLATKSSLSQFLGFPVSESVNPPSIASNQMIFQMKAAQNQAQPQKGSKSTLGGMKQLNLGERASTETQQLEEEPT